jgi:hypothetical protein
VQDGFLTTHTVENVRLPEPALMTEFVGDPYATTRLRNLMNQAKPIMSGMIVALIAAFAAAPASFNPL